MNVKAPKAVNLNPDIEKKISHLFSFEEYGDIVSITQPSFSGRNASWIIEYRSETKFFVKKIDAAVAGEKAFSRSAAFARFAEEHDAYVPRSPRLVAKDSSTGLLIFEMCDGESLAQLLIDEKVPCDFSTKVGEQLARLHSGPTDDLENSNPPSPPEQMLVEGVPYRRYIKFSLAELSLWKQLQEDKELIQKIVELRRNEYNNLSAPIHGDLRLDQFQMHQGQFAILDWEEFGRGDPARDLGTFAGEWIYRAILDSVTTRGGSNPPPEEFNTTSANQRIAERLAYMIPQINMMWKAYGETTKNSLDSDLSYRAVSHLGWHLLDRTLARAPYIAKLPGIERAAAGIGRQILLNPNSYIQTLGFGRSV